MMNWYEIRVQGRLDQHWSEWFDGLAITYDDEDNTRLCGPLTDEAALHGVLIKVRDLALPLLAVNRIEAHRGEQAGQEAYLTGPKRSWDDTAPRWSSGETDKKGQALEPADADASRDG